MAEILQSLQLARNQVLLFRNFVNQEESRVGLLSIHIISTAVLYSGKASRFWGNTA